MGNHNITFTDFQRRLDIIMGDARRQIETEMAALFGEAVKAQQQLKGGSDVAEDSVDVGTGNSN